jgi:hypothetical protein
MTTVVPPTERECERCGRKDVWDEDVGSWRIAVEDGERTVGSPHCIHEWDISDSYRLIAEEA